MNSDYPRSCDEFLYALRLRTVGVILFELATIRGDYVHLALAEPDSYRMENKGGSWPFAYPLLRGLDIRLEVIVWCADAPWGS
jgi:hypothetical protein